MLPADQRMRTADEFRSTIRHGVRVGGRFVVVHMCDDDARVGFVVSKKVGSAVTRNRVKRRLRHLARHEIETAEQRCRAVVRALPTASSVTAAELAEDFVHTWHRARAKVARGRVRL